MTAIRGFKRGGARRQRGTGTGFQKKALHACGLEDAGSLNPLAEGRYQSAVVKVKRPAQGWEFPGRLQGCESHKPLGCKAPEANVLTLFR